MKFKIIPIVAYAFFMVLLLALGNWQLGRAEGKRRYLSMQAQALVAETIILNGIIQENTATPRYKKAQAIGHYDAQHQFLIDNQVNGGKAGYFVLTPFLLKGQAKAVLVNRGWIPLTGDRAMLPTVAASGEETTLSGRVNAFPSVGVKLTGADIPTEGWPSVVQVVDPQILAKKLGYPLLNFQLELDKNLPGGFKRDWLTMAIMQPEQHIAYAIQWFALAFTLTVLFIWYGFKKHND